MESVMLVGVLIAFAFEIYPLTAETHSSPNGTYSLALETIPQIKQDFLLTPNRNIKQKPQTPQKNISLNTSQKESPNASLNPTTESPIYGIPLGRKLV